MEYETLRGKIHYSSDKPGREGQERGREWFMITKNSDGGRTLRAHSQIDDAPKVWRDVTQTSGPDNRPTDAFVRLSVEDEFVGSSWFRFGDDFAECEGFTAADGRISQRFETKERPLTFGTHPIQGDAWHLYMYDRSKGPGMQSFQNVFMSSLDHRGATGPLLVPPMGAACGSAVSVRSGSPLAQGPLMPCTSTTATWKTVATPRTNPASIHRTRSGSPMTMSSFFSRPLFRAIC